MAKWQNLTNSEMEILIILWEKGPSTVRDVFAALPAERQRGRTTTLKMMQLMLAKGLIKREEKGRGHVYEAAIEANAGRAGIVRDVVAKLFGGSSRGLALSALGSDFDPEELSEIEKVLDELEARK